MSGAVPVLPLQQGLDEVGKRQRNAVRIALRLRAGHRLFGQQLRHRLHHHGLLGLAVDQQLLVLVEREEGLVVQAGEVELGQAMLQRNFARELSGLTGLRGVVQRGIGIAQPCQGPAFEFRTPPGPACARSPPRGGQGNLGRPGVSFGILQPARQVQRGERLLQRLAPQREQRVGKRQIAARLAQRAQRLLALQQVHGLAGHAHAVLRPAQAGVGARQVVQYAGPLGAALGLRQQGFEPQGRSAVIALLEQGFGASALAFLHVRLG